jgi:hypothetical protein
MMVNACFWALGLEDRIPPKGNVDLVGSYAPTPFGFNGFRKGITPSALAAKAQEAMSNGAQ